MKIGIIGAGSVGLLLGAYLGRDHQVHMYVRRKEQKIQLEQKGIFCDVFDEPTGVKAHFTEDIEQNLDLWVVTVKQYDLVHIMNVNLPEDVPILFLQNGMAHLDKLATSPYCCWVGVVEHGALKLGDNTVSHTGKGNIQVARFLDPHEKAFPHTIAQLHKDSFPFSWSEDYEKMLTSKLVINTVINPVTALFQQQNHCIMTNPHIHAIARELCMEACTVLNLSFTYEWKRVRAIAEKTASNQSSMLKDLLENRKTEIDAINGYVLDQSKQPLPYHQFIVRGIHAIEHEKGVRCHG